jgi:HAD superfamily hydrolase (TIGR01549 family)
MIDLYQTYKSKKLICLDLDDTLINYTYAHDMALKHVMNKYEFTKEQYNNAKTNVKSKVYGVNKHRKSLYFKELIALYFNKEYYRFLEISDEYEKHFNNNLVVDNNLLNAIRNFRENDIRIIVLSNYYSYEQIYKLKTANILTFFNDIITSEDLDIEKPNELFFSYVLNTHNLTRQDVVMIGNSKEDKFCGVDFYPYNTNQTFFSIVGKSGSGKSTLALILKEIFNASIIECDCYHKYDRYSDMLKIITLYNPDANNIEQMNSDIEDLFYEQDVILNGYDHNTGRFTHKYVFNYNSTIVFEGLHLLLKKNPFIKFGIYIDNEYADEFKLHRDTAFRNKTIENVEYSIKQRNEDYENYIKPQKEFADIIIEYKKNNNLNIILKKECFQQTHDIYHHYENIDTAKKYREVIINIFLDMRNKLYV